MTNIKHLPEKKHKTLKNNGLRLQAQLMIKLKISIYQSIFRDHIQQKSLQKEFSVIINFYSEFKIYLKNLFNRRFLTSYQASY